MKHDCRKVVCAVAAVYDRRAGQTALMERRSRLGVALMGAACP